LLNAQIRYFEPSIIIFANGSSNTTYRREFFDPELYANGQSYEADEVAKNQLYRFIYDDKFICYRIQHPSTIRGKNLAMLARKKLIELLPE